MTPPAKTYIGDGVYAEFVEGELTLTTEYGADPTNVIYLDTATCWNLLVFLKAHGVPVEDARS